MKTPMTHSPFAPSTCALLDAAERIAQFERACRVSEVDVLRAALATADQHELPVLGRYRLHPEQCDQLRCLDDPVHDPLQAEANGLQPTPVLLQALERVLHGHRGRDANALVHALLEPASDLLRDFLNARDSACHARFWQEIRMVFERHGKDTVMLTEELD